MLAARVEEEIKSLHVFFVDWFTGQCTRDDKTFDTRFTARFTDSFRLIQPNGRQLSAAELGSMKGAFGCSPGFRIQIRNVELVHTEGDTVVALYEEWQCAAQNSTPPDNGRSATVVFLKSEDRLLWQHVHETWLPAEIIAADRFDF